MSRTYTTSNQIFQIISYLQYVFLLLAFIEIGKMYYEIFHLKIDENIIQFINKALVYLGLGIGFSSLQDTTKTQNKFSLKIWQNRKKGRITLILMTLFTFTLIVFGLIGMYSDENHKLYEVYNGFLMLGIGMIGFLKAAIEMRENHRLD